MDASITLIILAAAAACATIGILTYLIYTYYKPTKVTYIPEASKMIPTDDMTGIDSPVIDFSSKECTIIFWVYVNHAQIDSAISLIQIGRATFASNGASALANNMCIFVANGTLCCTLPCSNTANNCTIMNMATTGVPYMPTERWVQIAATASLVSNTMQLYVDGESVTSAAVSIASANVAFPTSNHISVSTKPGFSGLISNIAFSKSVLTSDEVQAEYNKGPTNRAASISSMPVYGWRSLFLTPAKA